MSDERPSRRLLPVFSLRTLLEILFVCGVLFYLWFNRPPSNVIQPEHVLHIDAVGVPPDQPINGFYLVDPDGRVNLGASHGKLDVSGMTADKAQAALLAELQKNFSRPQVSVSIAGWRNSVGIGGLSAEQRESRWSHPLRH